MAALTGRRDLNAARRAIQKAGYQGEKIVVLWPTNETILKALADVTIDTLKKLDLNIDAQTMDWSTVMQRRNKTEPVQQGGDGACSIQVSRAWRQPNPWDTSICAEMDDRLLPAGRTSPPDRGPL